MKSPDGREVFIWRGKDQAEDTRRLAATIADLCATRLFLMDGALHWFDGGQPVIMRRALLQQIITGIIVTVRLVDHGGSWEAEFFPLDFAPRTDSRTGPDDHTLDRLMDELKLLVARGPVKPLTERQFDQARSRLQQGEPAGSVADGLNVDIELIKRLRA